MLVLIDGVDLSGKTTVAQLLTKQLLEDGYSVTLNRNSLHPGFYNNLLDNIHSKRHILLPNIVVSIFDSIAPWVDAIFYDPLQSESILIQESYVDRAIAYLFIHQQKMLYRLLKWSKRYFIQFDIAFYLTASIEERHARYEKRKQNRGGDKFLLQNPHLLLQMEQMMVECMNEYPNFYQIDTSYLTVQDVVNILKDKIIEQINNSLG